MLRKAAAGAAFLRSMVPLSEDTEMSTASPLLPTFARSELAFVRGEGATLFAEDGTAYLDFAAGIAVNSLGHCHPHLVETLKAQAEKVWHVSNLYRIPEQETLGRRLVEASFADHAFFTNSGAEANECAIKMARKHHAHHGHPERYRIITFEGAFHGRTLATIAAGGQKKYIVGFGPKVEGFDQVPFGDHDAVKAVIGPETAAIMIEPIQGEGGLRPVPPQCLRGLRDLCDQHGLLLIYDEVQCGVGRTGKLFAYELSGAAPDILTLAKGIGGGFPLGVCLSTKEAGIGMTAGSHGTTFGGNPLACAVGNAVLDVVLADGFLDRVSCVALYAKQKLAALQDRHPRIVEGIRGEGLMLGVKLKPPVGDMVQLLRKHRFLTVAAGDNVLRLVPPLIVSEVDIDTAVSRMEMAAGEMEAAMAPAREAAA
jgi:acetylornithine/N-succinyldiaminopimelate aminotransferase